MRARHRRAHRRDRPQDVARERDPRLRGRRLNPLIRETPGSTIRALNALRRPTSINLGIGEPTLAPNLAHFESATRWIAANGCRYSTNIGDEDLRAAIAERGGYPDLDRAANVCITNGSAEAVYATMRAVLDPARDAVLVLEPAFPVYVKIAQVDGIALERLAIDPASADPFDPDAVLAALTPRTRLIVICSPNNPSGRTLTNAAAKRLADGLLARGGEPVWVLHDRIYGELVYTADAGDVANYYPHTITIDSISKSCALTGLRLGWAIAPADLMPSIVKMHGWVTSCANTFSQRVAHAIVAAGELGAHRPWYAAQREGALAAARGLGLRVVEPEGAFYLFACIGDLDATATHAFAERLIAERDVVAIPGTVFGDAFAGWLRTSYVEPLPAVREGLARIAAAVGA